MTTTQAEIMHGAGFVTAAEAAEAIGAGNVGTIHRMLKQKKLSGQRLGFYWYVSAASLVDTYSGTPIAERVTKMLKTLGVAPKKEKSNGIARAR